jgi:hypothetical protein
MLVVCSQSQMNSYPFLLDISKQEKTAKTVLAENTLAPHSEGSTKLIYQINCLDQYCSQNKSLDNFWQKLQK